MATLKIDASDLLGKLHVAAIDKVNKEHRSLIGKLNKLRKGRFGTASIQNSAFDNKTGKLNFPPGKGDAEIVVTSTGVNAWNEAVDMMKTYMKWWAGIDDFDIKKFIDKNAVHGRGEVGAVKGKEDKGLTTQWVIPYELTATEKGTQEIKDFAAGTKTDTKSSSSSSDSDIIDANESVERKISTSKVKVWESHPFEILFNKENENMINEEKTEKFVKEIVNQKNADAQQTLESILKEKIEKRIKEVLADEKSKK